MSGAKRLSACIFLFLLLMPSKKTIYPTIILLSPLILTLEVNSTFENCDLPYINCRVIKSRRLRRTGHVAKEVIQGCVKQRAIYSISEQNRMYKLHFFFKCLLLSENLRFLMQSVLKRQLNEIKLENLFFLVPILPVIRDHKDSSNDLSY